MMIRTGRRRMKEGSSGDGLIDAGSRSVSIWRRGGLMLATEAGRVKEMSGFNNKTNMLQKAVYLAMGTPQHRMKRGPL